MNEQNLQKVTAIIPAFDEEENIERALKSVAWADEIMVVDSFSNDKTVEIAKKHTNFILQHEYENSAAQKNWAIPQASHQWIVLLDADEEITTDLREEMINVLKHEHDYSAFWINRKNHFMGKKINYCGWQKDRVIRLFKKDECRYESKHVHAEITTTGKLGHLKGKINHYTYKDLSRYLKKFDRYSTWSAKDRIKKTQKVTLFHLFVKPVFRFYKQYFFKLGFLDGKVGFILCVMASYSVFLRYLKAWRLMENEQF